jgi:hypothetical protein
MIPQPGFDQKEDGEREPERLPQTPFPIFHKFFLSYAAGA